MDLAAVILMRLSRAPPLRSLRAFCVAARHRSFKVAADDLFLTPSAVSHQMRELEDLLGVKLSERRTRSLELTTTGHTLLGEMEPLLDALDHSLTQIARRGSRRRLRVLVPAFFAGVMYDAFRYCESLRRPQFYNAVREKSSGNLTLCRKLPAVLAGRTEKSHAAVSLRNIPRIPRTACRVRASFSINANRT